MPAWLSLGLALLSVFALMGIRIRKRLKAQALQVRELEGWYKRLYEGSPDAYLLIQGGLIVDCNGAALRLLRADRDWLFKRPFRELLLTGIAEDEGCALEGDEVQRSLDRGKSCFESLVACMDGWELWAEVVLLPMEMAGGFKTLAGLRDVTAYKQDREALQVSELYSKSLVSALPDMMFVLDSEGNFLDYRSGEPKEQYVSKPFTVGQNASEILPEAVYLKMMDAIHQVISEKNISVFHDEREVQGVKAHFETRVSSFGSDKVICLVRNITEQKENEALLRATNLALEKERKRADQASEAKGEFLAHMSHEIRTPLNGVLGMAELLSQMELNQEQMEYVSAINRSGENLLSLLNNILDFSKIEAGQLNIESHPFDIEQAVFDACELFRGKVEGRQVELWCEVDVTATRHVVGDLGRFRQVLNNLIGNAIKFTDKGYIRVSVEGGHPEGDRCRYRIGVEDTGIGISASQQEKLFNPFVQADASTARRYGGTGLGLVLVKRIVEAMDGRIELESAPGAGTRVFLDLAFQRDPFRLDEGVRSCLEGRRILVLDDLRVIQASLKKQLHLLGATVECAGSAGQAIALLEKAVAEGVPFDAVIVDLKLGGRPRDMDGEAFGAWVRKDARLGNVALVVLTATGVRGDAQRFRSMGFNGYLVKPVSVSILAKVVVQCIESVGDAGHLATRYNVLPPSDRTSSSQVVKGKVLLVEDQEMNRAVARRFLELAGMTVRMAVNGREALDRLVMEDFDLVLMDCQMPEMDGFEATRRLRGLEAGTDRHLPVIAMTAHAMAGDRERCLNAGMDDYLTKPISREAMVRVVQRWLERSSSGLVKDLEGVSASDGDIREERDWDQAQFHSVCEAFDGRFSDLENLVLRPFMTRSEDFIRAFYQSLICDERQDMVLKAHTLKGSARTLGFVALGNEAERLEKNHAEASSEVLKGWIESLESTFKMACRSLNGFLEKKRERGL